VSSSWSNGPRAWAARCNAGEPPTPSRSSGLLSRLRLSCRHIRTRALCSGTVSQAGTGQSGGDRRLPGPAISRSSSRTDAPCCQICCAAPPSRRPIGERCVQVQQVASSSAGRVELIRKTRLFFDLIAVQDSMMSGVNRHLLSPSRPPASPESRLSCIAVAPDGRRRDEERPQIGPSIEASTGGAAKPVCEGLVNSPKSRSRTDARSVLELAPQVSRNDCGDRSSKAWLRLSGPRWCTTVTCAPIVSQGIGIQLGVRQLLLLLGGQHRRCGSITAVISSMARASQGGCAGEGAQTSD